MSDSFSRATAVGAAKGVVPNHINLLEHGKTFHLPLLEKGISLY